MGDLWTSADDIELAKLRRQLAVKEWKLKTLRARFEAEQHPQQQQAEQESRSEAATEGQPRSSFHFTPPPGVLEWQPKIEDSIVSLNSIPPFQTKIEESTPVLEHIPLFKPKLADIALQMDLDRLLKPKVETHPMGLDRIPLSNISEYFCESSRRKKNQLDMVHLTASPPLFPLSISNLQQNKQVIRNIHPQAEARWCAMLSVKKDTGAKDAGTCKLCERWTDSITLHIWAPQSPRRSKARKYDPPKAFVSLCWPCHCILDHLTSHHVLTSKYHSIESVSRHSSIQAWVRFAKTRSISELRAFMKPNSESQPPQDGASFVTEGHNATAVALEEIWSNQMFPENFGQPADWALRNLVREITGSRDVTKSQLKLVMSGRPEWQEWYQKVFPKAV